MDVDSGTGGVWDSQGTWNDVSKFQFDDTPAIDWTSPAYSLKNFLGIDTLPESYTTGVVEESVRKIVSLHAPTGFATTDGALEGQFESKLGRIILAPWNDWDVPKGCIRRSIEGGGPRRGSGDPTPRTAKKKPKKTSRHSTPKSCTKTDESTLNQPIPESFGNRRKGGSNHLFSSCTAEKPAPAELGSNNVHDPSKDMVQLLVDPAVIDKLKDMVGLGLGGTFVQLVG
jgi:hypothetical protein